MKPQPQSIIHQDDENQRLNNHQLFSQHYLRRNNIRQTRLYNHQLLSQHYLRRNNIHQTTQQNRSNPSNNNISKRKSISLDNIIVIIFWIIIWFLSLKQQETKTSS